MGIGSLLTRAGQRTARAFGALAVLAGVLGMHALGPSTGSMKMAGQSPTVMALSSAHVVDHAAVSSVIVEHSHSTCVHEHCLAVLRIPLRLPAAQLVVANVGAGPAPSPANPQLDRAGQRAPPHAVCLIAVCVSRT